MTESIPDVLHVCPLCKGLASGPILCDSCRDSEWAVATLTPAMRVCPAPRLGAPARRLRLGSLLQDILTFGLIFFVLSAWLGVLTALIFLFLRRVF